VTTNRRSFRYRPGVDLLEDRQLLAASLTASFVEGILRVEGTEAADTINVRQFFVAGDTQAVPGDAIAPPPPSVPHLSVDGTPILIKGTAVGSVPVALVKRIEVFGLGGNDRVVLGAKDSKFDPDLTVGGHLEGGAGDDTLLGSAGHDTLVGQEGCDSLHGHSGNDTLSGGDGDDTLDGSFGNDSLTGGAGNDTMSGSDGDDVMLGNDGNDLMFGQGGFDVLAGGDDNDTLDGGAQDDSLYGEGGSDSLLGRDGNDYLAGDLLAYPDGDPDIPGNDTLSGGAGNDTLDAGAGTDRLTETGDVNFTLTNFNLIGLGSDTLFSIEQAFLTGGASGNSIDAFAFFAGPVTLDGGMGNDTLFGGDGDDSLVGGLGDDVMVGNYGSDTLVGGAGNDGLRGSDFLTSEDEGNLLDGGDGNDTLRGATGNDTLVGGNNDDSLFGSAGNDTLIGAAGNDTLAGIEGNDSLDGGDGTDRLEASGNANFTLTDSSLSGPGAIVLSGIERAVLTGGFGNNRIDASQFSGPVTLTGGDGHDTLLGGASADSLVGGLGNDSLLGGNSNDTLTGGLGFDTLSGGAGTDRVVEETDLAITLSNSSLIHYVQSGNSNSDSLSSIERAELRGNHNANNLNASAFSGTVTLIGGAGDDTLVGGAGDDVLEGGTGADLLNGGAGFNSYNHGQTDNLQRVLYLHFDAPDFSPAAGPEISAADVDAWAANGWDQDNLDAKNDGIDLTPFMDGQANREAVIQQVMTLLADDFRAAKVDVVRRNKTDGVVVGQNATTLFIGPATIDYSFGHGISSEVDFGNTNNTDVAFVKTVLGNTDAEKAQFVANVAAHEVGHTYGLRHVDNLGYNELTLHGFLADGPMMYQNNFTFLDRNFVAVDLNDELDLEPQLDPDGYPIYQNSYRTLMQNMGITDYPTGPQGGPVNDLVGESSAGATESAVVSGKVESVGFLPRLRPAEFVTVRQASSRAWFDEAVYRVLSTLDADAQDQDSD
jgi:Ca2+-binding RTX toxin-like protein